MIKIRKVIGRNCVCRVCRAKQKSFPPKQFYRVFLKPRDIKGQRDNYNNSFALCKEHLGELAYKIRDILTEDMPREIKL